MPPEGKKHDHGRDGGHQAHHARMVADFRRRFWVSVVLSVPRLAAALESQSEHPIAKGIFEEVKQRELEIPETKEFEAIPGKGAKAEANGAEVKVVSRGYLKENSITLDEEKVKSVAQKGKTVVYLLVNDEPEGAIALADIIREESHDEQRKREQGETHEHGSFFVRFWGCVHDEPVS